MVSISVEEGSFCFGVGFLVDWLVSLVMMVFL
jgi:hypothetical protein